MRIILRIVRELAVCWVIALIYANVMWFAFHRTQRGIFLVSDFSIAFVVALLGFVVIEAVLAIVRMKNKSSLEKLLAKKGYCDEYFLRLRKNAEGKKGRKKISRLLLLAGELCDGERFEEAVEVMKGIDVRGENAFVLGEYYNAYMYILVMKGDLENAELAFNAGKEYIAYIMKKKSCAAAVNHTLGVYEYAKGDYRKAEEHFKLARKKALSLLVSNSCDMYLSLIYLKTDRRELAKSLTGKIIPYVKNPRQKQDMVFLMRKIEKAYGLYEENKKMTKTMRLKNCLINDLKGVKICRKR